MAAILPSNGGDSEGLGGIEEKSSHGDFPVSLVCLVSWVFRLAQHSKRFSPNSELLLVSP
jgi:hypothetical protein